MMMMSAGTVNMAVRKFVFSCIAHIDYLYSKVKFNACQRVISIYSDLVEAYVCDRYYFATAGLKLHTNVHRLTTNRPCVQFLS